jgi:hypothetical protein
LNDLILSYSFYFSLRTSAFSYTNSFDDLPKMEDKLKPKLIPLIFGLAEAGLVEPIAPPSLGVHEPAFFKVGGKSDGFGNSKVISSLLPPKIAVD